MSSVFSKLTHTESAEHQIFLTFEKYCVPCENKVHERFFFKPRKKKGGGCFQKEGKKKKKRVKPVYSPRLRFKDGISV